MMTVLFLPLPPASFMSVSSALAPKNLKTSSPKLGGLSLAPKPLRAYGGIVVGGSLEFRS